MSSRRSPSNNKRTIVEPKQRTEEEDDRARPRYGCVLDIRSGEPVCGPQISPAEARRLLEARDARNAPRTSSPRTRKRVDLTGADDAEPQGADDDKTDE